jgi:hypothetical protein
MSDLFVTGMPGVSAERLVAFKRVFRGYSESWLPGGKQIAGAASRDPSNTGNVNVLLPGLVMGRITSVVNSKGNIGQYAPSILGVLNGALTGIGTTVTATAAVIAEIVRRFGATGSFKITGPPAASGVVRTSTATYSATGATTATITALGTNEVQQINFNIASTGGTVTLQVPKANGQMITTTGAAWNATDGTYLAAIQAVLDVATGVASGIVVSAIPAVDPDLGFILTYSGAGYAGLPQPMAAVTGTLPTSSTTWTISRTATGSNGAFVTGSLIQPADGSENPLTFINENDGGVLVTDITGADIVVPFHRLPTAGDVDAVQLVNWPADPSLRLWLMAQLSTNSGGKFIFDDQVY